MITEVLEPAAKTRVLIPGGRFGDLYAALDLDKTIAEERNVEVTLVSRDKLPPEAVRRVRAVAGKLLNQSEGYRALLRDLEAESKN